MKRRVIDRRKPTWLENEDMEALLLVIMAGASVFAIDEEDVLKDTLSCCTRREGSLREAKSSTLRHQGSVVLKARV